MTYDLKQLNKIQLLAHLKEQFASVQRVLDTHKEYTKGYNVEKLQNSVPMIKTLWLLENEESRIKRTTKNDLIDFIEYLLNALYDIEKVVAINIRIEEANKKQKEEEFNGVKVKRCDMGTILDRNASQILLASKGNFKETMDFLKEEMPSSYYLKLILTMCFKVGNEWVTIRDFLKRKLDFSRIEKVDFKCNVKGVKWL